MAQMRFFYFGRQADSAVDAHDDDGGVMMRSMAWRFEFQRQ